MQLPLKLFFVAAYSRMKITINILKEERPFYHHGMHPEHFYQGKFFRH
jgi:hypothetical protein